MLSTTRIRSGLPGRRLLHPVLALVRWPRDHHRLIGNAVRGLLEDPARWSTGAERFDLRHVHADQHLASGQGLHYRLGATLGKLEARLALGELARRFPRQEMRVRTG